MKFIILFFLISAHLYASEFKYKKDSIDLTHFKLDSFISRRHLFFKETGVKKFQYSLKERNNKKFIFYGQYEKNNKTIHFIETLQPNKKNNNHFILSTYHDLSFEQLLSRYNRVKSD